MQTNKLKNNPFFTKEFMEFFNSLPEYLNFEKISCKYLHDISLGKNGVNIQTLKTQLTEIFLDPSKVVYERVKYTIPHPEKYPHNYSIHLRYYQTLYSKYFEEFISSEYVKKIEIYENIMKWIQDTLKSRVDLTSNNLFHLEFLKWFEYDAIRIRRELEALYNKIQVEAW